MFSRGRILPLLLIIIMLVVWRYRQREELISLTGTTFGSIAYHIKYKDPQSRNFQSSIDSLLRVFNTSLNHYWPESELSLFNKDSTFNFNIPYFLPVLEQSRVIYKASSGAFNPAVMPLVNAWGFGPDKSMTPDSVTIDSLLQLVDFTQVRFDQQHVWKLDPRVQLDFSAIAKGYAVDVLIKFLSDQGINDSFVEIGGEVGCRGTNKEGKPWNIGIIDPASDVLNQSFIATVAISDMAVATSANNFNYVVRDGVRYTHTINPKTGYPSHSNMLSASVFAHSCMTADGVATAFMEAGFDAARSILQKTDTLDAFLVYSKPDGGVATFSTPRIRNDLQLISSSKP